MIDDIVLDRPGNMREYMVNWMLSKGVNRKP
jgi:hypothetical protein